MKLVLEIEASERALEREREYSEVAKRGEELEMVRK